MKKDLESSLAEAELRTVKAFGPEHHRSVAIRSQLDALQTYFKFIYIRMHHWHTRHRMAAAPVTS